MDVMDRWLSRTRVSGQGRPAADDKRNRLDTCATVREIVIPFFGRLALEAGMVSLDQIHECLGAQLERENAGREVPHLGRLLVSKGHMSVGQVEEILRVQQARAGSPQAAGVQAGPEVTFQPDEFIFQQGDESNFDLLVLLEGTVEVRKGGEVLETFDKKGTFLGEVSAMLRAPHAASVVATSPCRALRIPARNVFDFLRSKPAVALRLSESLAERLAHVLNEHVPASPQADAGEPAPSQEPAAPCQEQEIPASQQETASGQEAGVLNLNHLATLSTDAEGSLLLQDIRAPELTFVNGEPVDEPRVVNDEDTVQIGRHVVQVFLNHPHRIDVSPPAEIQESQPACPIEQEQVESEDVGTPEPPPPPPPPQAGAAPSDVMGQAPLAAAAVAAQVDGMETGPLPEAVTEAVEARLHLQLEIDKLDDLRAKLASTEGCEDDVKRELASQRRELRRIPPPDSLKKSLKKLQARLAAPKEGEQVDALPEDMKRACELSVRQKQLLLARADKTLPTLRACASVAAQEPLYGVCGKLGIASDQLFGWSVYATTLKDLSAEEKQRLDEIRPQIEATAKSSNDQPEGDVSVLIAEQQAIKARRAAIARELKAIEREMVSEFWTVYEAAAVALVAGIEKADEPFVRALLRRGLLGCSGRFLDGEIAKQILCQCIQADPPPQCTTKAAHVLYADELIELVASGQIPNSHDEQLELRQANTPLWKADRGWRRGINCRIQQAIHEEVLAGLQEAAADARRQQSETEKRIALLNAKEKGHKEKRAKLREDLQEWKVEAVRKERLIELMNTTAMPRLAEKAQAAHKQLATSGVEVSPADRARHEVATVRQQCRLAARLSEPFLPFTLRTSFRPEQGDVNERDTIVEALAEAERCDPLIFSDPLVPGAKKAHRVLLRTGPIVVLLPAPGIMGMVMCPRCDGDNGCIALPGHFSRGGIRQQVLWNVLADYRYDTSKAAAGVDALGSDTLVAAYSEYRWSMRKKDRIVRQKAGVYSEENDRTNWRRHYELYIKSASDNGKQLFFKSPDLYQRIVGKFIDLPEGGEILKRT